MEVTTILEFRSGRLGTFFPTLKTLIRVMQDDLQLWNNARSFFAVLAHRAAVGT